jgi:hypothetical protein
MSTPNRGHLDDLSLDEFYPVIFGEDTHLAHPVVFFHREAMLEELNGHS